MESYVGSIFIWKFKIHSENQLQISVALKYSSPVQKAAILRNLFFKIATFTPSPSKKTRWKIEFKQKKIKSNEIKIEKRVMNIIINKHLILILRIFCSNIENDLHVKTFLWIFYCIFVLYCCGYCWYLCFNTHLGVVRG